MMKSIAQTARKTGCVRKPRRHCKSTLERNFSAAASSRKPMKALTVTSQEPDFGILARYEGNSASRKNGEAKAVLKASMPTIGQTRSPCVAEASNPPTKPNVQVKEVSVKVSPIKSGPTNPP